MRIGHILRLFIGFFVLCLTFCLIILAFGTFSLGDSDFSNYMDSAPVVFSDRFALPPIPNFLLFDETHKSDRSKPKNDIPDPVPSVNSSNWEVVESSEYYTVTYGWSYSGYNQSVACSIPKECYDYYRNESHEGRQFDQYALSEYDRQILSQIIEEFKKQGQEHNFTSDQIVFNIISFIQALPYTSDSVTTGYDEYPRYPIETLVDGGGDCEDSSILAAALISEMGYGVILLEFPDHVAIGVKGEENIGDVYYEYNGSKYYYVETTSSGYSIGVIPPNITMSSSVKIHNMEPSPSLDIKMSEEYLNTDSGYAFYKILLDIENKGPTDANGVVVQLFAEAPPFDGTSIWPPQFTVPIDTILAGGNGHVESVFSLPVNNYTRLSCLLNGDNFAAYEYQSDLLYIELSDDSSLPNTPEDLDSSSSNTPEDLNSSSSDTPEDLNSSSSNTSEDLNSSPSNISEDR